MRPHIQILEPNDPDINRVAQVDGGKAKQDGGESQIRHRVPDLQGHPVDYIGDAQ
jgi:hypothetical protein